MTRTVGRRARRQTDVCRKCYGTLQPMGMPSIGVTFLPKGGCCGGCHYRYLVFAVRAHLI